MALRCSVLGHAWDEPEVEREREDRGSEAVVTVREFRACKRCGDRDVLSEVTEVKPAESADGTARGNARASTDSERDATGGDDAEILDEERADTTRPAGDGAADDGADNGGRADDGVILDADEDDPGPREWPDPGRPDDEDVDYEPRPWPDVEPPDPAERGPRDPDPLEAAEPIDDSGGGEPVDPAEVLSEAASEQDAGPDDGEVEGDLPLEDVEVFCPDCGFVDERPTPSLRGGDSCPECRNSYLEERDDRE